MKFETLYDLLELKLKALYDIESEIIKALPRLIKAVHHPKLEEAFKDHLRQTEKQKARLQKIFTLLEARPKKTKVEAIRGLVNDAKWLMKKEMRPKARDASLIAAARYIEHYEMAGYAEALNWAECLDRGDISALLETSLVEEREADKTLEALARIVIDNK